jgi:hypothetical protein
MPSSPVPQAAPCSRPTILLRPTFFKGMICRHSPYLRRRHQPASARTGYLARQRRLSCLSIRLLLQHGQRVTRGPIFSCSGYPRFAVKQLRASAARPAPNLFAAGVPGRYAAQVANIASTAPDVIASGNIGCITQLASGTSIPVMHTVELLDWAAGGPEPAGLSPVVSPRPAPPRSP